MKEIFNADIAASPYEENSFLGMIKNSTKDVLLI
jgi:hypothetical protein